MVTSLPLIVDLDGTLIHTDMLQESTLSVVGANLFNIARLPFWLKSGKAALKQQLAARYTVDVHTLPYNQPLIAWLKAQKATGRRLILCTATDQTIANDIAAHLGIFDEVMASDGIVNLAAHHKARALSLRFGHTGFDYVGNSRDDLTVWRCARRAIVVNASATVLKKAATCCPIERIFAKATLGVKIWFKMLRVHQWMKNALLFIPLIAAHQFMHPQAWLTLIGAFFAFSLCASAIYIANDLVDLNADRLHPRKAKRPFASGTVPVWLGLLLIPLLLLSSFSIAALVSKPFLIWLAVYFTLTTAYSFGLKRLVLIDCLTLAILYTLRVIAGAAALQMPLSFWLLASAVFLFLSLAFVKRYAELQVQLLAGKQKVHGRGYYTSDASMIQMLGITSGYGAALVLALYLNSAVVSQLYKTPEWVWGAVPVMLFWISWMWLQAHRGKMHDDPLVFAVKDTASLCAGAAFIGVMALGTVAWPW